MGNTMNGYYWAFEKGDEVDADWILVFVELDQTIWYGKVQFTRDDFVYMEKLYLKKPNWTPRKS